MHMAITLFYFVLFSLPHLKLFCFYIFYLLIFVYKHVQLQYVAFESVVMAISDAGGLNAIEELQNHPNQNIYSRAVKMLEVR